MLKISEKIGDTDAYRKILPCRDVTHTHTVWTLLKSIRIEQIYTTEINSQYRIDYTRTYLTTSTAPALTFGSLPMIDTLAVNEPSILNTTASVLGGSTVR